MRAITNLSTVSNLKLPILNGSKYNLYGVNGKKKKCTMKEMFISLNSLNITDSILKRGWKSLKWEKNKRTSKQLKWPKVDTIGLDNITHKQQTASFQQRGELRFGAALPLVAAQPPLRDLFFAAVWSASKSKPIPSPPTISTNIFWRSSRLSDWQKYHTNIISHAMYEIIGSVWLIKVYDKRDV